MTSDRFNCQNRKIDNHCSIIIFIVQIIFLLVEFFLQPMQKIEILNCYSVHLQNYSQNHTCLTKGEKFTKYKKYSVNENHIHFTFTSSVSYASGKMLERIAFFISLFVWSSANEIATPKDSSKTVCIYVLLICSLIVLITTM